MSTEICASLEVKGVCLEGKVSAPFVSMAAFGPRGVVVIQLFICKPNNPNPTATVNQSPISRRSTIAKLYNSRLTMQQNKKGALYSPMLALALSCVR